MADSYYFYDLETTSGSPRDGRIMQFAGQRTDEHLQPIGEPDDLLVKLSDDTLPEPDAILVHKITPQKAIEDGLTEKQFVDYFQKTISKPNTIFVGYNNIRFDDEFMRRICYRTFYDPYQWHWKDGRSRWDLLDAIRMMRALRPDGLKWPMLKDKPSVKLELMAKENGLLHENAHNALSDVNALVQLAQRFREAQPKLFNYLVEMRDKRKVSKLAMAGDPFVYTSGSLGSEYDKTTLVHTLFKHPRRDGAIVYNLREDPTPWLDKSVQDLVKHWTVRWGDDLERLPVKALLFNKCPAVAPEVVLDDATKKRIKLDTDQTDKTMKILRDNPEFTARLQQALDIIEDEQQSRLDLDIQVDSQIYDGFWSDNDQAEMRKVRQSEPDQLGKLQQQVSNPRIRDMVPLYKARNYPKQLTDEERSAWEEHRTKMLTGGDEKSRMAKFYKRMQELQAGKLTDEQQYLLTELQLYAESIIPISDDTDQS